MASWLFWHQLYCWLSKAEFTLGLALACTHAMGLTEHEPTIEYLVDLIVDVQTVRSCQTAAELDPELTAEGYCIPGRGHVAAGSIAMQKARQRITEILRILPGSSLWKSRSGVAVTKLCNARPCFRWPPITSPLPWTAGSRRSSFTPTVAFLPGAVGSAAPSTATTSSPTLCSRV